MGAVQIAARHRGLDRARVLVRCRINRLSYIDRITSEPIRRYEQTAPGEILHIDVTKFGDIPDGGGHRYLGRGEGGTKSRTSAARSGYTRSSKHPATTPPTSTQSRMTTPALPTPRYTP